MIFKKWKFLQQMQMLFVFDVYEFCEVCLHWKDKQGKLPLGYAESRLFHFAAQCFITESTQKVILRHSCV
jgi:hypothetical protein